MSSLKSKCAAITRAVYKPWYGTLALFFAVFEVSAEASAGKAFRPGSSLGDGDASREHFRHIMRRCRTGVTLPPDFDVSFADSKFGTLHKLVADGKTYLVYEGL